jgi:hypothetical protein
MLTEKVRIDRLGASETACKYYLLQRLPIQPSMIGTKARRRHRADLASHHGIRTVRGRMRPQIPATSVGRGSPDRVFASQCRLGAWLWNRGGEAENDQKTGWGESGSFASWR